MVEQRYLAVREVLEGRGSPMSPIRYGIDCRIVRSRLVRYAIGGLGAMAR